MAGEEQSGKNWQRNVLPVMSSGYHIREISSKRDVSRFVRFPERLYRGSDLWVPPLRSSEKKSLLSSAPAKYCKLKMWIVEDSRGTILGRIAGMINPRYNELYSLNRARFGWFDTINDSEVSSLLFREAEQWAVSEGMSEIHGPLYFNTLGKQGMLVEGFENRPVFNCLYNYPYYKDLVEAAGYTKELDYLEYKIPMVYDVPERIKRVSESVKNRMGLHEGSIDDLKKNPSSVRKFFEAYNDSFEGNVRNFVPFTEEEMDEEAASIIPFVSDRYSTVIMDTEDNPVAFGIAIPDLSDAFKKAHGSLFPFGWFHLLRALRGGDTVDLMINGAVPQWQGRGLSSLIHVSMIGKFRSEGVSYGLSNPQIETGEAVRVWDKYPHTLYMRRRCYIKSLI